MTIPESLILSFLAISALVTVLVDHPRIRRAFIIALITLAVLLVPPMVATWVTL